MAFESHGMFLPRRKPARAVEDLERGWDSNAMQKPLTDPVLAPALDRHRPARYDALKDPYCDFTESAVFMRHFTQMLGNDAHEILDRSHPSVTADFARGRGRPGSAHLSPLDVTDLSDGSTTEVIASDDACDCGVGTLPLSPSPPSRS